MKKVIFCLLIAGIAQLTAPAQAQTQTQEQKQTSQSLITKMDSHRMGKKIGITTGFGNPFPSILGMNINYNLTDFVRATAGYGEISVSSGDSKASVTTLGAGADAFVPGWSFSPTAGLRVSKVDVSSSGGAELEVQGVEKSTTLLYAQAGLDWQSQGGFNLGLGQVVGISGGKASGSYLNLGWYF